MSIRELKEADAQTYKKLRLEALREAPDAFGSSEQDEANQSLNWFQERLLRNTLFGAFEGETLRGVIGFYVQNGEKLKHKGVIWGLYVQPSMRGSGMAQQLLRTVLDYAHNKVESLKLTVKAHNESARRLYEQFGFQIYGHETKALRIGDKTYDELLMEREA